jgi:hypothetical protein
MSHVISAMSALNRKISPTRFCTKQRKLESKMRIYKFLCEKLGGLPIKIKMLPPDLLTFRIVGCKFCEIIFLNYGNARTQNENLQPTWQNLKTCTTNMAEFTANNANPDLVFEGWSAAARLTCPSASAGAPATSRHPPAARAPAPICHVGSNFCHVSCTEGVRRPDMSGRASADRTNFFRRPPPDMSGRRRHRRTSEVMAVHGRPRGRRKDGWRVGAGGRT